MWKVHELRFTGPFYWQDQERQPASPLSGSHASDLLLLDPQRGIWKSARTQLIRAAESKERNQTDASSVPHVLADCTWNCWFRAPKFRSERHPAESLESGSH